MTLVNSKWRGPYSIIPIPDESVQWLAKDSQALQPGVYLWSAYVNGEYRVNYIGMSTNSVIARTMEHVSRSFGVNTIERPELFRKGVRGEPLFSKSKHNWNEIRDDILPKILEYLNEIRFFFAPIDIEGLDKYGKIELERIESALIDQIWKFDQDASNSFLTNNRRSRAIAIEKRNMSVNIALLENAHLCGISEKFKA